VIRIPKQIAAKMMTPSQTNARRFAMSRAISLLVMIS
jgi:hypothetical protein